MRSRAALVLAGAAATALLASVGLGQAHAGKARWVCHRHGHRRVCRTVHVKPTKRVTSSTTTTTTSSSSGSAPAPSTATTTISTQTTATPTMTTSTSASAPPALAHGTEVDERATGQASPFYSINAYQRTLAAGTIHFNVYNYDQDPHTLAIDDANGQPVGDTVAVPSGHTGTPVTLTVSLPPGTYVLFCTLPQHAAEGMQTTIVVK